MAYPTQQCITLLARQAKYLPGVPDLRVERVAQNHRLSTIGAGRNNINRHAGQFFDTFDVVQRRLRQALRSFTPKVDSDQPGMVS